MPVCVHRGMWIPALEGLVACAAPSNSSAVVKANANGLPGLPWDAPIRAFVPRALWKKRPVGPVVHVPERARTDASGERGQPVRRKGCVALVKKTSKIVDSAERRSGLAPHRAVGGVGEVVRIPVSVAMGT